MNGWGFSSGDAGPTIAPAAGLGQGVAQLTTSATNGSYAGLQTDAEALLPNADAYHVHARVAPRALTSIQVVVGFYDAGVSVSDIVSAHAMFDSALSASSWMAQTLSTGDIVTEQIYPDDPNLVVDTFHEVDVLLVPDVFVDVCVNGHRQTIDTNVPASTRSLLAYVQVRTKTTATKSLLVDRASARALWGDYTNPKVDPRFNLKPLVVP